MDSTKRFSDRVENYVKYRPSYPEEIIKHLQNEIGLSSLIVADIGSGTGILSELFLKNGNKVFGIEPNREMREAAEKLLEKYPGFVSIDGTAEATTLDNQFVDVISAGQSFHWFDVDRAKKEFLRILKPGGYTVLVWNVRKTDSSPFSRNYENLLVDHATDYKKVNHRLAADEKILNRFYGHENYRKKLFDNYQVFDFEGLKGRLLSSSYSPLEGQPRYSSMMKRLEQIFAEHQVQGVVKFEYTTEIYTGQLEE
ncbi:MAG: class I SAM-dependent methyltransferase [Candidatus Odinarchaeota archaeon]